MWGLSNRKVKGVGDMMEYAGPDEMEVEMQTTQVMPLIYQQPDEPVSRDVFQMLFMLGLLILVAILRGV